MSQVERLIDLKNRVGKLNEELIRAEQNHSNALSALNDMGYDTPEQAQKAFKELGTAIEKDEISLEEMLSHLEDTYASL